MKPEMIVTPLARPFEAYRVVKRDGKLIDFEPQRITSALTKAFLAAEHNTSDHLNKIPSRIEKTVADLTDKVINGLKRRLEFNNTVHIEDIQDQVELELMRAGEHKIAREYVLYREKHAQQRAAAQPQQPAPVLQITDSNGVLQPLNEQRLHKLVEEACDGLKDVDPALVVSESLKNVFDGIGESEINRVLVMTARMLIEKEPNYTYVAARLLLDSLRTDAFQVVGKGQLPHSATASEMIDLYKTYFKLYIQTGLYYELLTPALKEFDIEKLAAALIPERDFKFTYLGFQTLFDRYFLHWDGVRFELPQAFFMRVAMGLSLNEQNKEERAIEFYRLLSSFDFMSSTPTLFNSATPRSQLSSCYLTTISDDLAGIYNAIRDNALLSKFAGGLGNDWSSVRAMGSRIKGTNGKSQGVVPFMKVANDTLVAVNQGGRRKGSGCAYLETWHLDIEEFLELRKNTGDERRRTHDMNTANWIPDLFMIRVLQEADWTLFSPDETPDLHELYGKAFETAYLNYEAKAANGEIKSAKKISAVSLWRKMLTMLFETGHPWVTFKDPCNLRSPQQHVGVVHSSNLCCIAADQRVVTDRGLLTVGELYKLGEKNKVVGLDGIYNASEMLLPRPNAPMVCINTKEGYSHKVTPDHKVWVKDIGWIEAQHLKLNDKLLIQQLEGLWGTKHNPELSYMMGLIAGDGTFDGEKGKVYVDIWKNDFKYLQPVEETVHYLLEGNTVLKTISTNTPSFNINSKHKRARLSSTPLYRLLEQEGFTAQTKLQVPPLVWQGDRETVAAYLKGLYQADGNLVSSHEVTTLALASINLPFIQELQILWANFGVKTSINQMRDHEFKPMPDDKGGTKEYWSKPLYRLLITSIRGCQIAEEITQFATNKFSDAAKQYLANLNKEGYQQKLYATFSGLTELPNEDAYCLMVDSETHAWTVNGLITKNTEITLNTSEEEIAVCFPRGTLILTDQGQVPIEHCDSLNVYVPFDENIKEQQRYLKAKLIPQGEKLVYQIVTQNGIVIEATENHPFLVQEPVNRDKPKQYVWKKLKELQIGDFLVCPLTVPIYLETGKQDKDFTAAGWMLGDGWMSSSYGVCFAPHETFAQNFVLPILNSWHQNSKLGNNAPHDNIPTPYFQPNGVINWHSQRQGFIEYVKERFGFQKAVGSQKRISDKIKNAEYNQIASFLSGLFSADGSVIRDKRKNKGGVTVSLSSASIDLLRDVQMLLKPFGVHGRIRGMKLLNRNEHWQGQLDIKGAFSLYNFIHFIGFSLSPVKQQILVDLLPLLSKKSILQHSAVVSIIPTEVKEVFDLSLEEDHTFIANGLVVHNCNLGSINLPAHIDENGLNEEKLAQTIQTAMRMLDNVVDINYYAVPQAEYSNLKHRPVGLGIMGFQDALYKLRIPYSSQQAIDFADKSMELISYYAIQASMNLAKERGTYSTFDGSLWSKGILPIDTLQIFKENRNSSYLEIDFSSRLDWEKLREQVKQFGMRNSNCMAIAPTATISNICGVTQSIEPTYQNLFVKSNLSGEFTVVNPYLAEDLKKLELWDEVMVNDLKYFDGSVQAIDRIPNELKELYATAFEIDSSWLIEAASRRQKWIDQAQSLNLYMKEPSGSRLDNLYRLAWLRGLKTTYYLRTLGATHVEKNTIKSSSSMIKLSSPIDAPKACLIDDPECEACQ